MTKIMFKFSKGEIITWNYKKMENFEELFIRSIDVKRKIYLCIDNEKRKWNLSQSFVEKNMTFASEFALTLYSNKINLTEPKK
jgi:hypothetical protein